MRILCLRLLGNTRKDDGEGDIVKFVNGLYFDSDELRRENPPSFLLGGGGGSSDFQFAFSAPVLRLVGS